MKLLKTWPERTGPVCSSENVAVNVYRATRSTERNGQCRSQEKIFLTFIVAKEKGPSFMGQDWIRIINLTGQVLIPLNHLGAETIVSVFNKQLLKITQELFKDLTPYMGQPPARCQTHLCNGPGRLAIPLHISKRTPKTREILNLWT